MINRVPPPVVGLVALGGLWLLGRYLPQFTIDVPGRAWWSGLFVLVGVAIDLAAIWGFYRARTTVNPLRPERSSALVTEGVYRLSRNPMYLGMLAILTGFAVYQQNVLGVLVLAAFVAYITQFQIIPEERALASLFGEQFEAYRRRVRRWV